jgi:ATP-dependent exoDNAse (exonuclease V) beta subunit
MSLKIEIISASAGTGKTYRLMEIVGELVISRKVRPEQLVAVTYTCKAAEELKSRVRQKLLESGKTELAYAMGSARIGTIHSICAQLLEQFAYEGGSSPSQRVLDVAEADSLFRQALGEAYDETQLQELTQLARAFECPVTEFLEDARILSDMARKNKISPEEILKGIPDSFAQIDRIFPKASADLDPALLKALSDYCDKYKEPPDTTAKTIKVHQTIRAALARLREGTLTWKNWADLAGSEPAVKSAEAFEDLLEITAHFASHPKLHLDLRRAIELVLNIAASGLGLFAAKKRSMGILDYTDMEAQMLSLLDNPSVQSKLKGDLKLLLVDEFQDTNPIQLAIYMKLTTLCERTVWVGDTKQSIFAFNGADPTLMRAVLDKVEQKLPLSPRASRIYVNSI